MYCHLSKILWTVNKIFMEFAIYSNSRLTYNEYSQEYLVDGQGGSCLLYQNVHCAWKQQNKTDQSFMYSWPDIFYSEENNTRYTTQNNDDHGNYDNAAASTIKFLPPWGAIAICHVCLFVGLFVRCCVCSCSLVCIWPPAAMAGGRCISAAGWQHCGRAAVHVSTAHRCRRWRAGESFAPQKILAKIFFATNK